MIDKLELGLYLNGTDINTYKPDPIFSSFIPTYVNRYAKSGDTYVALEPKDIIDFANRVCDVNEEATIEPMYWLDIANPYQSFINPSTELKNAIKNNKGYLKTRIVDELDCENRVVNRHPKSKEAVYGIKEITSFIKDTAPLEIAVDYVPHLHPTVKKLILSLLNHTFVIKKPQIYPQYNPAKPQTFSNIWRTKNYVDYAVKMNARKIKTPFESSCLNVFHNVHPYHKHLDTVIHEHLGTTTNPEKEYNKLNRSQKSLICFLTSFDALSKHTNRICLFSELWFNTRDCSLIKEYIKSGNLHKRYKEQNQKKYLEDTTNNVLTVIQLQKLLVARGMDLGSTGPNNDGVDGIYGPRTSAAIYFTELDLNLEPDGLPDGILYSELIEEYFRNHNKFPDFI